jgi:hypothetical protein
MKKSILSVSGLLFLCLVMALTSCKKFNFDRHHEKEVTIISEERQIKTNETLKFELPESFNKRTPVISTQPLHFLVSLLEKDETTGKWVYTYTPKVGYVGNEKVVIDSEEDHEDEDDHKRGPGHGKGGCGNHGDKDGNRLVLVINTLTSVSE